MVNIGSGNGLLPARQQAITWTSADLLSIGPYLNQYWFTISWTLWNAFENAVWETFFILRRPYCKNVSFWCFFFICSFYHAAHSTYWFLVSSRMEMWSVGKITYLWGDMWKITFLQGDMLCQIILFQGSGSLWLNAGDVLLGSTGTMETIASCTELNNNNNDFDWF